LESVVTQQDVISHLERVNTFLSDEVQRLHDIIREERQTNRMLLKRLGIFEQVKQDVQLGEVNPIGGITPLRTRIRDLEAESRLQAAKQEQEDATEE
jgi:hypothetical protein